MKVFTGRIRSESLKEHQPWTKSTKYL